MGPNGGLLLVGMGPGLANTEANLAENERAMGVVTKAQSTKFKGSSHSTPGWWPR